MYKEIEVLALSSMERCLVSRMLEIDESQRLSVISNLIDPSCGYPCLPKDVYIDISGTQSMKCFMATSASPMALEEHVLNLLATVALLFRKLESFGLIHFAGTISISRLGDYNQSVKYIPTNFIDADLAKLLMPYTQKRFWIAEELRELSKRDYKTQEEVRHEKELKRTKAQLNVTRLALGLSLVGIIVSVVAPRYATTMVDFANPPVQAKLQLQDEVLGPLESIRMNIEAQNSRLENLSTKIESLVKIYIKREQAKHNNTTQPTEEDVGS